MDTETPSSQDKLTKNGNGDKDSFGNDVKKSPWLLYALLQIPLVIIMVIILVVMYHYKNG